MLASQLGGCRMDFQKELVAEYERETTSTRKILYAIPESADFGWKPHDKSMTLGRLAAHVAGTAGDWAVHPLPWTVWIGSPRIPLQTQRQRLRFWTSSTNRWRTRRARFRR